jgi:hypothetical protein
LIDKKIQLKNDKEKAYNNYKNDKGKANNNYKNEDQS